LPGVAGVCETRILKPFSLLRLAACCGVLRSRWCQSGVNYCRFSRFSASICAITRSACFPTLSHSVSCCWLRPDVVLMDLLMPRMDGIATTEAIRAELPGVEVVALTSVLEDAAVTGAVRAGVIGYLLKDTKAEELSRAIKGAATSRVQLSPKVAARLMRDVGRPDHPQARPRLPMTFSGRRIGVVR
jgi:CheY-like chemotaxis protein